MIYTKAQREDLQEFFLDLSSHSDYEILELDVSKYDKSQSDFHFSIEMGPF